jgi:hypothetical protein
VERFAPVGRFVPRDAIVRRDHAKVAMFGSNVDAVRHERPGAYLVAISMMMR